MQRRAAYAGSFDPVTMGHLDILKRVLPLFDKIYLVIADNIRKNTLFTANERAALVTEATQSDSIFSKVEVKIHKGLIVNFCRENQVQVLVRGLRALSDFENEFQIASMNRRLAPEIETIHVMTDERFYFVSSTLIKEVAHFNGELSNLIPENVKVALKKKLELKS